MILSLRIRNVALIEEINLSFHQGLQVLSGETGAGKSIIVDAVSLLLGGRADKGLIRTNCDKASVEAEFESDVKEINEILVREKIDWDGKRLTIYREIGQNGRNICRINGILIPVALLREISPYLLSLHGQSEHQFLADPERHLSYLDLMGGAEHEKLINQTKEAYQSFIANHRQYARLRKQNENKEYRMDLLKRELEELHQANIFPGEEEQLRTECIRMEKSARINGKISDAYYILISGEEGNGSMHNLQSAAKILHGLQEEDKAFEEIAEKCEYLSYELEEISYRLNLLKDRYEYEPNRLESAENRLEYIKKIEHKYGTTELDVLSALKKREDEYELLCGLEKQIEKTGNEHKKLLAAYRCKARELSDSRKRIATVFEKQLINELKDLGMQNTVFKVFFHEEISEKPKMPTLMGDDQVEFMISPNQGEPLKPLAKIASGGELSRLMLALKSIESGKNGQETMIFDEIDTGISGRMAQAVAEKMIRISRKQQVICISHLPQIAAAADYQYIVHKDVKNGRTNSAVDEMGKEERIKEIGRMISGAEGISTDAEQYARRMIEAAAVRKCQI